MGTGVAFAGIDIENCFCPGGELPVAGGDDVAAGTTAFLRGRRGYYDYVAFSLDQHPEELPGHFAETDDQADYVSTWPRHGVAGTWGAEFHPAVDKSLIDDVYAKGMTSAAYSITEAVNARGESIVDVLRLKGIKQVHLGGLATDYCVRASAIGLCEAGFDVTVLEDLCAGVAPETSAAALAEMREAGATVTTSKEVGKPALGASL